MGQENCLEVILAHKKCYIHPNKNQYWILDSSSLNVGFNGNFHCRIKKCT